MAWPAIFEGGGFLPVPGCVLALEKDQTLLLSGSKRRPAGHVRSIPTQSQSPSLD